MQAAAKMSITIPADHRVELKLPDDLPAGPAEVIILTPLRHASQDRLMSDEAELDGAAVAAVAQDSRFQEDGGLLVFTAEVPRELQDELDHRRTREERLEGLGEGGM